MGQPEEGLASLTRAFDYYVEAGNLPRAAAVAECPVPHLPGKLAGESQLLVRALALVPPDSVSAGRLQSLYGEVLGVDEGDYEGAHKAFTQALATARQEGDEALEMQTLARSARVNGYHLRLRECLDQSLLAIGLARRVGDPVSEANSHYFAALALWSVGNAEGARLHAEVGLAPAERLRDRLSLANLLWASETIGRLTGDYRSAREFSDRGLALMPEDPRLLGTRTLLEYEVGDLEQGDAYYQRLLDVMQRTASGASFEYAFLASVTGFAAHYTGLVERFNFEVAKRAAVTVLSWPVTTPLVAIRAQTGLALMAVEERDVASATERYEFHKSRRGTMTPGGMGSVDHLLGLLAMVMGQTENAMEHFQEALAFCGKAGYRPEYAHAACDYAIALLEQGRPAGHAEPAQRTRAMSLLNEALAIARELGMRPLIERVIARRDLLHA
jgi:tetratricopeptide (TPR) repeat protein